jgi:cyanophycinase
MNDNNAVQSAHPCLILIGGEEDKEGEKVILSEVLKRTGAGKFIVTTVASHLSDEVYERYEQVFRSLGARHVEKLAIESREDARAPANLEKLKDASGIFFTGGDQLRITSLIGGSPLAEMLRQLYLAGVVIAGTSAGASVPCETMLVGGDGCISHKIGEALKMAPGLGFIRGIIVDQHFAQRGRLGRVLGAVAHNPAILGIGLDEDTAIVIEQGRFAVLGSGAAYVLDARDMTYSNVAEAAVGETLSVHRVILHTLVHGETFDLDTRKPSENETALHAANE